MLDECVMFSIALFQIFFSQAGEIKIFSNLRNKLQY